MLKLLANNLLRVKPVESFSFSFPLPLSARGLGLALTAAPTPTPTPTPQPIHLTVNGRPVTVSLSPGATLLDAINEAKIGGIPAFCTNPRFSPHARCRMCLVQIDHDQPTTATSASTTPSSYAKPKLVPSCATPATEGLSIHTHTPELESFRRANTQMLLSRHPNECIRCEVSGSCKLQSFVKEQNLQETWPKSSRGDLEHHPEHLLKDHTSPAIWRDIDKCIECGLCVQACGGPEGQSMDVIGFAERGSGTLPVTVFDTPLKDTDCISCGQCTVVCPVGALIERPDWQRVLSVLDSKERVTVVQTAPATRVAIGEEFGLEPGAASTGRLVNALRNLGFDYVFDTNFAADVTIFEEASELLERIRDGGKVAPLPLFTSCCPGWVNYLELRRPDLLPHLSTTKSPMQIHGTLSKHGPFRARLAALGIKKEPFVVAVMPCTAKKDEAVRPDMQGDVDAVITTRELARMIRSRKIPFASLSNDGEYDNPLGKSSGAAVIFGASGGVMEAALRSAMHFAGIKDDVGPLEFKGVRGVARGVKTAVVPGVGQVAVCSGISAAQELLRGNDWRKYVFIEVMACVGGCLGGGGEPKSDDPKILEKRAGGVYSIDERSTVRRSHENPDVQTLYKNHIGKPLSETAEKLLHHSYAARRSSRDALARFLAAVDQRDGKAASALFDEEGVWKTNGPLGTAETRQAISELITSRLPPAVTETAQRHVFDDPYAGTVVHAPDGSKVQFRIVMNERTGLIRELERVVL